MSRLLALLLVVLRRSLWLGALGLVLLALYVSLGRQLVPLAAEYRAEVQAKAQELLRLPVAIGSLEGRWEGFAPRLVAHDVVVGEGAGAMRLEHLALVPDLAASLIARRLELASVELAGVQLGLAQDAAGHWQVDGLPRRDEQPAPDVSQLLAQLQRVHQVRLLDSQFTIEPHAQRPLTLTYANVGLRTQGERLWLDGRVLLPDGQPLSLHGEARVALADWQDSQASLYLSLPQSDWSAWLPAGLTGDWSIEQLRGGGELWLDWHQRRLARAVARLNVPSLALARLSRPPVKLEDLALNAYLEHTPEGGRLQLDGLAFTFDAQRWRDTAVLVRHEAGAQRWRVQTDHLPVGPVAALVHAVAPLPAVADEYLLALAPSGTLRNLQLDYRPAAEPAERLRYSANLDALSIAAHHWVPAVRNVSGEVRGDLGSGELRFDNRDFALHLAPLFPAPWDYRRARGRLRWTLDEQAVTLNAPYLQVDGEEGQIAGDFLIRLMRDPAAEDYMDLRVGIRNGDARFTEKYLPTRSPALSPALSEWLTAAIRGGTVEQGYFQYQGSLAHGADETARSLSLYFKVKDAELAFLPGWPALREGRGEVLVENSGVRVRLAEARMLDSQLRDATATIPRGHAVSTPRLAIEGAVDGRLRDALTLLQVAPIGTGELFAGWQAEGPLSGALSLDIPLVKGERPQVVADFTTRDASLFMTQADLALDRLAGQFRYDSERGFSAESFTARALGSQVRGSAAATGSPGQPASRIEASATLGIPALLAWRQINQPLPASGELPLRLTLGLGGAEPYLQLDSSLRGTELALPAPFGKSAGQRRDTTLRTTLGGERQDLALRQEALLALTYSVPGGDWAAGGGELVLGGGAANRRTGPGLYVRGSVPRFELAEWQAVLARYAQPSAQEDGASLLRQVRLDIGAFDGFGTHIDGLGITLDRREAAWTLGMASDTVSGNARLPDAEGEPIVLDLSRLRLPPAASPDASVGSRDALAGVDPKGLPAMDIRVADLRRGDESLGSGALKMRPQDDGVVFESLDLSLKGLHIGGSAGWNGAGTAYKGRVEGGDLADVLLAWGFAPSTTSEDFRLDADVSWPGSPAFFAVERLSGRLDARLRKGQLREVDGGAQALRVFGLLNFDSIGRRLRLDFSDLFSKGLSYDRIDAELKATDGVYQTENPLTVAGPSSNLELDGRLDLVDDRIDAKLRVTLPVSNNLPLAALIVGAPAIGGALFVVDKLLGDRVARFASVQYNVEGPWQAPQITFDKPFDKSR